MDYIEALKGTKGSHSLMKISVFFLIAATIQSFAVRYVTTKSYATKYGYLNYDDIFHMTTYFFAAMFALTAQYMIKFFKSAKTMCALSMAFIFPLFMFEAMIESTIKK